MIQFRQSPGINLLGNLLILVTTYAVEGSNEYGSELPVYCELWNAALCKPATQISTHAQGTSIRAVDGNRIELFKRKNCVHTVSYGYTNWWVVDLMDDFLVHKVVVTNRGEGYHVRINNVYIELFLSDPRLDPGFPSKRNGVLCTYISDIFKGTKSFDCNTPTYARFVRVMRVSYGHFNFCEVEIMVSKKRTDPDCQRTVSKNYDIERDSVVDNAEILVTTSIRTSLACVDLCRKRGYLCNGCYWSREERLCQILKINPYTLGNIVKKSGTDFYIESRINCLGDGIFKYV